VDSGQQLLFAYRKKQWAIKDRLAENANQLIEIITNCE